MVETSLSVSATTASIQRIPAKVKRQEICKLLTSGERLTDGQIACQVNVSRMTVFTVRKQLFTEGAEVALSDGRAHNGAKSRYEDFWKRLEELKKQFPHWGGRNLYFYCLTQLGMSEQDMPSIGRIEGWLSSQSLTHKVKTSKTDNRPYWTEDYYQPNLRVGMDVQTIAPTRDGARLAVVSVIDFWSRAVYSEAFPVDVKDAHFHGMNPVKFAGVFVRYCAAFGTPKTLVLDNGAGQVTQSGWLPGIAQVALDLGVRVEWEPYGRPWKNGAVEVWHNHSQRWWEEKRKACANFLEAQVLWREYAWLYTTKWPQRKLGNKAAISVLDHCVQWPMSGPDAGPIAYPLPDKGKHQFSGTISFQREVESGGYVQLHGNDHMHVSEQLIGGYVRIDAVIMPNGHEGLLTVREGHGEIVLTAKHRFQCFRSQAEALVFDKVCQFVSDTDDVRVQHFDQVAHNRQMERAHKNARARAAYQQTGTVPTIASRKGSK